jgi:ATP-dependent exoDNAse (exonuclease V) beta subunit
MLHSVLNKRNPHCRDEYIQFMEEGHKYTITCDSESKYTSVTTWIHSHFPHFDSDKIIKKMMSGKNWKEGHKYWNMTADQIKLQWKESGENMSSFGTNLHYEIECFMNNPNILNYTHEDLLDEYNKKTNNLDNKNIEWEFFIKFISDTLYLKPYRTEWTVFHEDLKLAGSIDMVYENDDGTLSIYDWKRSKNITPVNNFNSYAITKEISHMPDSNFWHYTLQLNIYKKILEEKYDKKIKDLYLVRLHPNNDDSTYELIKVPFIDQEVNDLVQLRKKRLTINNISI